MKRALRWSLSALTLALLGAVAFLIWHVNPQLNALAASSTQTLSNVTQAVSVTATPVSAVGTISDVTQAVSVTATPVSAVGTIELISKRQVVLQTDGSIAQVAVEEGDTVKKGDLMVALDTQQLDWAVTGATLALEEARIALEKASEAIEDSDIAVAQATLLSANEQLALVKAGPTKEQLEGAKAAAAAAWAAYNELKAGPSPEELTQSSAALKQAEIDLQQAQRAYDKIAWQPDAGASSEGAALQRATIAYESAKAGYDELVKPPKASELQGAVATAQEAQDALNELQKKPTPAELASAQADVASADAALAKLKKGKDSGDIRAAELGVQSAQIALEQAKLNQSNARVLAPADGVVLDVTAEEGAQGSAGTVVATVADVSKLRLVADVEQKDIHQIQVGQPVEVTVYGIPNKTYKGVVDKIAPQGSTDTGSITFPVMIRFTDESVAELRPGMSATATFQPAEAKSNG
jgi:multidrug efflux pump subunit AcrA (membrane-fusion protein)